jgi:hypothetical protein
MRDLRRRFIDAVLRKRKSLSRLGDLVALDKPSQAWIELRGSAVIVCFQLYDDYWALLTVRRATKPFRGRELFRICGYVMREDEERLLEAIKSTVEAAQGLLSEDERTSCTARIEGFWQTMLFGVLD